jgi:ABC-type multidrug transport system ATPase subunit
MPVIEVSKLRKTYGKRIAVDEASFTVEEGEIFGIVGPNGAGKTTTVESVTGLRRPSGGEIRVLGHDPLREPAAVREKLGVQLQDGQLPDRLRVGDWRRNRRSLLVPASRCEEHSENHRLTPVTVHFPQASRFLLDPTRVSPTTIAGVALGNVSCYRQALLGAGTPENR